ncbi:hypothetical protein J5N97_009104 [Dioscorea zingiberensis]|uniref:Uncharacterized protein n=1 Tax=Dioscorea zingiberensis TaxID=325984 RepID=A0A9D5CXP0_9LILI|nr:hypothetical protein J5N97_009104 [Dioscorea zingiberensis]
MLQFVVGNLELAVCVHCLVMGYCPDAWNDFSWGAFRELGAFTRLSITSGIMMCLEMWFYTILVMLVGQLPNPKIVVAAMSIWAARGRGEGDERFWHPIRLRFWECEARFLILRHLNWLPGFWFDFS